MHIHELQPVVWAGYQDTHSATNIHPTLPPKYQPQSANSRVFFVKFILYFICIWDWWQLLIKQSAIPIWKIFAKSHAWTIVHEYGINGQPFFLFGMTLNCSLHGRCMRKLSEISGPLSNNLPLNAAKYLHLRIGRTPTAPISLSDGTSIPIAKSSNDLGSIVTSSFKTSSHCREAVKRARGALFQIWRDFAVVSPENVHPLY